MSSRNIQPLIFGEVLFDEFDDGSQVLGGAPFNVAWHLKGFGLDPLFVSRIGEDETGQQVLDSMRQWGMFCEGIQQDQQYTTGRVTIKLVEAQPEFTILFPAAYDYIETDDVDRLFASTDPSLLYHGSLASRSEVSAQSLQTLKKKITPAFVDINLRDPWWNYETVVQLVQGVDYVKLNDNELTLLSDDKQAELQVQAENFLHQHHIQNLIVTRGAEGAWLLTENTMYNSAPVEVVNMMDTVGAGDAFSAVCLLGILKEWPEQVWLQRASMFASAVCAKRGATVLDEAFYSDFIQDWQS